MSADEATYRRRELLTWYVCGRKRTWTRDEAAARAIEGVTQAYPCHLDPSHWHCGRPFKPGKTRQELWTTARLAYRRDVRRGLVMVRGERVPLTPEYDFRTDTP